MRGGITKLYPFFWSLLERSISELFSSTAQLLSQSNLLVLTFSRATFYVFEKMKNEKTNYLTIEAKLYQNVTNFYPQQLAYLFQVQQNLRACGDSKISFPSNYCTDNDSQKKLFAHVE